MTGVPSIISGGQPPLTMHVGVTYHFQAKLQLHFDLNGF
jgi:hypothetical protein